MPTALPVPTEPVISSIPANLAKSIADEIITTGRVTHAFFGVQTVPIPPEAAAQAGVSEGLFVGGSWRTGPPSAPGSARAT